jgi:hypothetical protein
VWKALVTGLFLGIGNGTTLEKCLAVDISKRLFGKRYYQNFSDCTQHGKKFLWFLGKEGLKQVKTTSTLRHNVRTF